MIAMTSMEVDDWCDSPDSNVDWKVCDKCVCVVWWWRRQ